MRQLYRAVLSGEGAELVYAENGAEALDRAAQTPDIDLFIEMKSDMTTLQNFNISVAVTDAFMTALLDGTRDARALGGDIDRLRPFAPAILAIRWATRVACLALAAWCAMPALAQDAAEQAAPNPIWEAFAAAAAPCAVPRLCAVAAPQPWEGGAGW